MDVKQDVASGSGGMASGLAVHLQGMVGRDTFECLEKILFGVAIDFIAFIAVVLMIVLMHREKRQEVIVIEGRRYFRPCKVKEKKYNRNGIWLLLLVLGQHGVMAAELNKEGQRIGTLYRSDHVEDSDSNALMQQAGRPVPTTGVPEDDGDPTGGSGSSDDERQIRIHAFMRVKAYTLIRCGESETELVSLIAEANTIEPEEVMALHEVFHPPAHLNVQPHDHVFIGELRRDAVHRLTSDDVLCLFSIEFQNPSRLYDVQTRLQVQWTSNWMNREDILHFIRIAELCRMRVHPVTCMTWLNNRFLAEDSTVRHEIKDGDMIRILVQSPTHASVHELICNLREAERVQRNRVFYLESSSEEDSTSENGEEEEAEVEASGSEEVEEPRRSRSRSRDREDGEGVELLQRSVKKLVRRKGVTVVNWSPGNEEESTREPGSNKTLFRRSPLDTFVSNFERLAPPGNPQQQESTACRISLHDALFGQDTIVLSDGEEEDEGERIRVNDANIKLHENHAGFLSLLQSWSGEGNGLRLDMPDNFDPCPVAFQFLCRCVEGPSSRIEELHIYTDGSYNPKEGNATFAAGIFGYDSSREPRHFFLGWLGDRVIEDPEHGHYIGARMQSSEEAEASGLLWAHLWLLQFPGTWDVTFHYDSLTVGNAMQGQWNTRDGWLQGRRLRDIALLCKSAKRLHAINYEHCKAHPNQPCNEFVDAVAKALGKTLVKEATKTWIVAKQDPSLFVAEDQRLQWAWWHIDVLFDPVLPKWCDGELKVEAPRENWSTQGVTAIEHGNKGSLGKVEFRLKVVSYNVMTLQSVNEDGKHQSEAGRAEFLRKQFDYFKVHAIGLQEARGRKDAIFTAEDYIRIVSGGSGGAGNHHGCELWLSRIIPFGVSGGKRILLDTKMITVIFSSPRLIAVNVNLPGGRLQFVVAHAPHEMSEDDDKEEWWQRFEAHIGAWRNKCRMIIVGDFNARLQVPSEGRIGDRLCDGKDSNNGERLSGILDAFNLVAPSTFSCYHQGQDWTWTHPKGNHARLDYVLLQCDEDWDIHASYVENRITTSTAARDHEPVVLEVGWNFEKGRILPKQKSYDWEQMATREGRDKLRRAVASVEIPAWDTDVHEHWQLLEDGLHRVLHENFPSGGPKRRRDIFREETWDTRQAKVNVKTILADLDELEDRLWQSIALQAWHDGADLSSGRRLHLLEAVLIELVKRRCLGAFRHLSKRLREGIKEDKAIYIETLVSEANNAKSTDIYKKLKQLRVGASFRKKAVQALPQLRDEQGEMAGDAFERDAIWSRHCARMEAGVRTTTHRLLLRARRKAVDRWDEGDYLDRHLQEAPTLQELEGCFRRVKMHKAPGADSLRSDLCHLAPTEMAKQCFSLLLKVFWKREEPVQMKGGVLISAHKGGDYKEVSNFRSLLLSSHMGKCMRRPIRQRLVECYAAHSDDLHLSVRPGSNVAHASISLRLFLDGAGRQNLSAAVLYLDIKAAYYRVIRQIVVSSQSAKESVARLLLYFDLNNTCVDDLLSELDGRPVVDELEVPDHLASLLEESLSSTWFTTIYRTNIHESLAGSRPGDGMADVIFAMIFRRIMVEVKSDLAEHFEMHDDVWVPNYRAMDEIPENVAPPPYVEIIWADDLAIAVAHKDPEVVIERIKLATQKVFNRCCRLSLIPNLAKGKTEIILRLKGKNSRQLRAHYFNQEEPHVIIDDVDEDFKKVRLASRYKHLGTQIHTKGGLIYEIKARLGAALGVYRQHRRQVFQNKKIDLEKRKMLLRTLVLSIVRYNTGTWSELTKGEFRYFKSRLYRMYRGIARGEVGEEEQRRWNDERLLAYLELPCAQTLLHEARLSYMISALRSGPQVLWRLAASEQYWLRGVREAVVWAHTQLCGIGPDRFGNFWNPDMEECAKNNPKRFKKWIRQAVAHACAQQKLRTEWEEWHHGFVSQCIDFGLEMEFPWPQPKAIDEDKREACLPCGRVFASRAAWAVHCFKKHGRKHDKRFLLTSSRCEVCLREYGTTVRLMRHLDHSIECAIRLRDAEVTTEIGPGANSTQVDKDGDYPIPVLPVEGPHRPWEPVVQTEWKENHDPELAEKLIDFFLDLDEHFDYEQAVENLKGMLASRTISFSEIRATYKYIWEPLIKEWDEDAAGAPRQYKVDMLWESVWMRLRIDWFIPNADHAGIPDDRDIRSAAWDYCRATQRVPSWKPRPYIPRMKTRQLNYVHLFSGERREGDLQQALGALPVPDGCICAVLSVDIIFDSKRANLRDPRVQAQWLEFVWAGKVHALYVGPPCESWSRARALGGLPNETCGDGGPRVLRTSVSPQGLSTLRVEEVKQLIVANQLLHFALTIFFAMLMAARLAVLEHPATPDGEQEEYLPSIWRLWVTKTLANHGAVQLVTVFQGFYHGLSPKPTNLLIAAGPKINAQEFLDAKRTRSTLPAALKMTRGEEYSTAVLKNYPKDFCRALAGLAAEWNSQYVQVLDGESGSDAAFNEYVKSLVCHFNLDAQRGADFHR